MTVADSIYFVQPEALNAAQGRIKLRLSRQNLHTVLHISVALLSR